MSQKATRQKKNHTLRNHQEQIRKPFLLGKRQTLGHPTMDNSVQCTGTRGNVHIGTHTRTPQEREDFSLSLSLSLPPPSNGLSSAKPPALSLAISGQQSGRRTKPPSPLSPPPPLQAKKEASLSWEETITWPRSNPLCLLASLYISIISLCFSLSGSSSWPRTFRPTP